ncbi:hypothetical protein FRB94_001251 [Tulasnella sp. JGI-2019a]|nr:hypothetical protein FRB93_007859 [Tulasnella sp. JGI-2019a]KAG9013689.1 hypothetical protein FRB94_001251 [Tulasnella sp. JGI-2019a]
MPSDPNTFLTGEVRKDHPQEYQIDASSVRGISFPHGLNLLDVSTRDNLRINVSVEVAPLPTIRVTTWGASVVHSSSCTWLEVARNDRDFQHGVFSTVDDHDHSWRKPKTETRREVSFEKPFAEPPKIMCWLNKIDADCRHDCRVKTYAENITKTGFTLYVSTWADSILYAACTTWIAYPANRSNITSGSYHTRDVRPSNEPQARCECDILFDRTFQKPPVVLAALNWLEIGYRTSTYRAKTLNTNITTTGMAWHLDTWGDTTLYSAGASYLAIQDY